MRGFSARNLKNMRTFFEEWQSFFNSAAVAAELETGTQNPLAPNAKELINCDLLLHSNRQPMAVKFEMEEFLSLGFSHHIEILARVKNVEERIFYIHQAYQNQWNKYKLRDLLKADLYHHRGALPNKFAKTMSDTRTALQAIEMFKDEYLLDFINVIAKGTNVIIRILVSLQTIIIAFLSGYIFNTMYKIMDEE